MRFTNPEKWNRVWFRKLTPESKLVWLWLQDNCDIAGFWEIDPARIAFDTGMDESKVQVCLDALSCHFEASRDFIRLPEFLKEQKNWPLNPDNSCHKGILQRLEDRKADFPEAPCKPLPSPIGKGRGKSTGKGKSKGQDKGMGSGLILSEGEDGIIRDNNNVVIPDQSKARRYMEKQNNER